MGRSFSRNPETAAGSPPLRPVRLDPPISCPLIGDEVGELMQERPLCLTSGNFEEGRVQLNHRIRPCRPTRRGTHAPIPFHDDFFSQTRQAVLPA